MKIQFLVIIEKLSDAYRALEVVLTIYGLLRMTRNDLTLNYLDFFTNFDVVEQNFLVPNFYFSIRKNVYQNAKNFSTFYVYIKFLECFQHIFITNQHEID